MNDNAPIPCTVAILTKNSAGTLGRALESVKDFSDIIVCDGGSTDDTVNIAGQYGARVIVQDPAFLDAQGRIADFAAIRNQTLGASRESWFFFLDSDEYISKELENEIRRVTTSRTDGAFTLFRRYVLDGQEVMCATTYPNPSTRLFAKSSVVGFIKKVHERIELKPGVTAGTLQGKLFVPVEGTSGPSPTKMDYYIGLQIAQSMTSAKPFYRKFLDMLWWHARVSLLYLLRLVRIRLFCRGTKMPLKIELSRHVYHVRLLAALWRCRHEYRKRRRAEASGGADTAAL